MNVHLVDGTYELFRAFYGAPPVTSGTLEVGATRSLLRSMLALLDSDGVSHVAVAFDTRIESFRNDLFDGYKTGEGIDEDLFAQFPLVEQGAQALGLVVWSMIDFEADDAIAAGAAKFRDAPGVEHIYLCSPDKDLCQSVRGDRVQLFDRMRKKKLNEAAVVEKFGVRPDQIPDYLALVGDAADGIPGIPRFGAKSTAAVLSHFGHIEDIPDDEDAWAEVSVRGKSTLCRNLAEMREEAALYKTLATLREDVPLDESLDDLRYRGADREALTTFCRSIGDTSLVDRVRRWAD